jgi:endonuclease-3
LSDFDSDISRQIHTIAQKIVTEFNGQLPAEVDILLSFKGIGIKCTHVALGIACGQPYISVNTHVHRVTNRWGYVQTNTPEKTTAMPESKLPQRYWIEINQQLVPFGKHVCVGKRPHCSSCPVSNFCQQVGVENPR